MSRVYPGQTLQLKARDWNAMQEAAAAYAEAARTQGRSGRLVWLVLVLLLANVCLWVWLQGWARPWGFAPATSAEPWRLQRQIQPDQLTLLGAEDLARAELKEAVRTLPCWQIGPLDEASHST